MASSPRSPVRMRITSSMGVMKIFPSPMRPVLAAMLMVWVFADAFYQHTAPRGWASILVIMLFMGSVQLICLGIIGEYIRLIFQETKRRPTGLPP